jgi:hypothetical protein
MVGCIFRLQFGHMLRLKKWAPYAQKGPNLIYAHYQITTPRVITETASRSIQQSVWGHLHCATALQRVADAPTTHHTRDVDTKRLQ